MATPPRCQVIEAVVTRYSKPRFPGYGHTLEVGGPKFRPPVHKVHRYLSHASYADATGSKSNNDCEAQANQRNDTGREPAPSKCDQHQLARFFPKTTRGKLD
jgi:hypothetical protein